MFKVKNFKMLPVFITVLLLTACGEKSPVLKMGKPADAGFDPPHLQMVDREIDAAVERGEIPGGVLLVARKGTVAYYKEYGYSYIVPEKTPMTKNTVFDMASMTKPIGTATSIMILLEDGEIRLWDFVTKYIPEFTPYVDENGEEYPVPRIYNLLTHTSGLPAYTPANELEELYGRPCPEKVIEKIAGIEKFAPPGEKFRYSCLNFITLAEIVHRVSGQIIDDFAQENIFKPLGMTNTTYNPPDSWKDRIAPTEVFDGEPLVGFVHDPLAQLMDGSSGNAGLFSTAWDVATFFQMMLNEGEYDGARVLSPLTVRRMISLYPGLEFSGRALGWDISSAYSSNTGHVFPTSTFGHTGFTGTSGFADPTTGTIVVFLTNRVHVKGAVLPLRSKIANIIGASLVDADG